MPGRQRDDYRMRYSHVTMFNVFFINDSTVLIDFIDDYGRTTGNALCLIFTNATLFLIKIIFLGLKNETVLNFNIIQFKMYFDRPARFDREQERIKQVEYSQETGKRGKRKLCIVIVNKLDLYRNKLN